MGLDEMYCVDKRFMDGYGGCTDVLMCTQMDPEAAKEDKMLFWCLESTVSLDLLSSLQLLPLYSSLHQSCNVEIFESFCPPHVSDGSPDKRLHQEGDPSSFWLLRPKFAAR